MIRLNKKEGIQLSLPALICMLLAVITIPVCIGQDKETITVIDLLDREITLDVPVDKVILQWSGSGGGFLTLFALEGDNAPQKIAGMDPGLRNYRMWVWEKFTEKYPELEDIPNVGDVEDLNVEKIISLNPDVVVVPASAYESSPDLFNKLEKAEIPVVTLDYHSQILENHQKSILLMGKLLGKDERAQELADFYTEGVNIVNSHLEKIDKKAPTVYVECAMNGPSQYGNSYGDYMWGALVRCCGGINIATDVISRAEPINPEYLLAKNPDVIVLTGSYWPATPDSMRLGYYQDPGEARELLKAFTERPGWNRMDAVKNNRVYSIHHALSRNIWDFVANQYFAKIFYPEEFEDLDPEESLKEFHERFLTIDYEGTWMISLDE